MERISVAAALGFVALVTLACKGGKTDDSTDAGGVTTTAASASASTAPTTELSRYDDEQPLDQPVPIKLKKPATLRRTADKAGPEIASLVAGDTITATAVHQDFALASFGDKTGWIDGDILRDALGGAKAGTKPAGPPRGGCKVGMILDDARKNTCVKACTKNEECMSGPCEPVPGGKGCTSDEGELLNTAPTAAVGGCKPGELDIPEVGCMKPCTTTAQCGKNSACMDTSYDAPSGGTAHARVCTDLGPSAAATATATATAKPAGAGPDMVHITEGQSCPKGWVGLPGFTCARPCKVKTDCSESKSTCTTMNDLHFCDSTG